MTPTVGSRWADQYGEHCQVAAVVGRLVTLVYDNGRHDTVGLDSFGMELRPLRVECDGQMDMFGGAA